MGVNFSYLSMGIIGFLFGILLILISVTSNETKLELAEEHPVWITGTVFSCNTHIEEDDDGDKYTYNVQVTYRTEDGIEKIAPFYGLPHQYAVGSEIGLRFRDDMTDPILASSIEQEDLFYVKGFGGVMILFGAAMIAAAFIKRR